MIDFISDLWLGLRLGWWEAYALVASMIFYIVLQYI